MSETTRRAALAGAAGLSAAAALGACGGDEPDDSGTGDNGAAPAATATAGPLASVADIPVGSGKVFARQKVVVTQPTAGEIKAYSAECTHQGCTVSGVENGLIRCPCHQSRFKITDGSVDSGPAAKPLPPVAVKVENGNITLG